MEREEEWERQREFVERAEIHILDNNIVRNV